MMVSGRVGGARTSPIPHAPHASWGLTRAKVSRLIRAVMPIAELHQKVPKEVRASEDTLTSGAFGLLTVLPAERCLAPWLRRARRLDGTQLEVPEPVEYTEATFWPWIGGEGTGGCEPDALLALFARNAPVLGLLVEVKYKSGISGWPTDPIADPEVRGQLGKEWMALASLADHHFPGQPKEVPNRALVYVTPSATFPRDAFRALAAELEEKRRQGVAFLANGYWLSWFSLAEVVGEVLGREGIGHVERVALVRLLALLETRRLVAFAGMHPPKAGLPVSWKYASSPTYDTAPPSPCAVAWNYSTSLGGIR
jgi:hypothetical protein